MRDLDQGDASVPAHRPHPARPYMGDVSDAGVAHRAMQQTCVTFLGWSDASMTHARRGGS